MYSIYTLYICSFTAVYIIFILILFIWYYFVTVYFVKFKADQKIFDAECTKAAGTKTFSAHKLIV